MILSGVSFAAVSVGAALTSRLRARTKEARVAWILDVNFILLEDVLVENGHQNGITVP